MSVILRKLQSYNSFLTGEWGSCMTYTNNGFLHKGKCKAMAVIDSEFFSHTYHSKTAAGS